eukprot:TRINITY_DN8459_c0_g2_i3.p1 TRINITY_DN8459_c0_g2~~TRINITY_DN8459_c0_g2_i3.p1  ORF type:complete len:126 (-),score=24.38 TRINITY_DN8459_c0_g2_i3:82-459(-)
MGNSSGCQVYLALMFFAGTLFMGFLTVLLYLDSDFLPIDVKNKSVSVNVCGYSTIAYLLLFILSVAIVWSKPDEVKEPKKSRRERLREEAKAAKHDARPAGDEGDSLIPKQEHANAASSEEKKTH